MLGLFGVIINGITAAIFVRETFQGATWDSDVAGWLVGYTLVLFTFYTLAPLILRHGQRRLLRHQPAYRQLLGPHHRHPLSSAYPIHYLYPIAFVLIIVGLMVYFGW